MPDARAEPVPARPPRRLRLSRRAWLGVAFGVFVFLGLSALLARALGGAGAERNAVLELVRDEARGDGDAVLARLPACAHEPACAAVTRDRAVALRRPGRVEILAYDPSVRMALEPTTGTARVAWRAGDGRPVVQCLRVRRDGPLDGAGVELLSISAPIRGDAACP